MDGSPSGVPVPDRDAEEPAPSAQSLREFVQRSRALYPTPVHPSLDSRTPTGGRGDHHATDGDGSHHHRAGHCDWDSRKEDAFSHTQSLREFVKQSRATAPVHPYLESTTAVSLPPNLAQRPCAHAAVDKQQELEAKASYKNASVERLQPIMEVAQVVLYGAEWLVGAIVWGGTADRLDNASGCYFGKQSSCTFIILAGVCAWIVLNLLIAARVMAKFSPKFDFLTSFEAHLTTITGFVWTLVALVASVAAPSVAQSSTGNAVIVFAWINTALTFVSAALAINFRRSERDDFSVV